VALESMTAVFITSTGTDIGKTFIACGLIRHLRDQDRTVDAIKPVVSGFLPRNAATSDVGLLLAALGRPTTIAEVERISPWRFKAPLSPNIAAKREERRIDFDSLVDFSKSVIEGATDVLLIEGVGGVMVPLDECHTVLDWMVALARPIVLVAGNYLGTISHTLTALEVLESRKLEVLCVVISERERSISVADNAHTIARLATRTEVLTVPRLARGSFNHPTFVHLAGRVLAARPTVSR
jgi:dethiobiotin synthetase